jgi:hypothetical protein
MLVNQEQPAAGSIRRMARNEPEIDYVEYTSIHFPSDRLAVAELRHLYPAEFDEKGPPSLPIDPLFEQIAAQHGMTLPPPEPDWLLEQLRALPADQTLRDLRRRHAHVLDVEGGLLELREHYQSSSDVSGMLWLERALARIAYQEACGNPWAVGPSSGIEVPERDGYRDDLIALYQKFGLVREKNEARETIARFEAAAAAQAAADRNPPRGR